MATQSQESPPPPNVNNIDIIYAQNPDLLGKIREAIVKQPALEDLFRQIAQYHFRQHFEPNSDAPAGKRRKLVNGGYESSGNAPNGSANDQQPVKKTPLLEVKDVSFSLPLRKKMHLTIAHHGPRLTTPNTFVIWGVDPKTGKTEFEAPLSDFAHVFCLPVPEKPQKSFNYCFVPPSNSSRDSIVFTIPAGPIKNSVRAKEWDLAFAPPSDGNLLDDVLTNVLHHHKLKVIKPDAAQFASAFPEPQRRSEKAYHVKAYRGTKDGFLFFLSSGILFGFKKPLMFLPLEEIESVSFVRAVSRTFGLAIAYREDGNDEVQELEFDQIDTQEANGIGEYVQRHQLKDASFAEARRAKIAKSKEKNGGKVEENGEGDGRTELEKAEQELQDQEDEEEEDYDPDEDEGEDDGSESGSEDEYTEGKGEDLVGEELGSEAEDVTDDDGEDEEMEDAEGDEEEVPEPTAKLAHRSPERVVAQPLPRSKVKNEPDPEDDEQL